MVLFVGFIAGSYFTGQVIDHAVNGDINLLIVTALGTAGIYAAMTLIGLLVTHLNLKANTGIVFNLNKLL